MRDKRRDANLIDESPHMRRAARFGVDFLFSAAGFEPAMPQQRFMFEPIWHRWRYEIVF